MKSCNENIKNELAYFYKVIKNMDIKDNIKQSKINEHETPFDEILYDLFFVGENMAKQSRASIRKWRTKLLYLFSTYGRTFVFYMFISVDIPLAT